MPGTTPASPAGAPGRNSTTLENAEETAISDAVGAASETDDLLRELVAIWGDVSPEIQQAILVIARQSTWS
ncbi:MAG: hypothetical protein ABJ015_23570 [Rhodopirellula bahusiensis]